MGIKDWGMLIPFKLPTGRAKRTERMMVTAQCGFCRRIVPGSVRNDVPDADVPLKVTYCTECDTWYQRLITYGQGTPIGSAWGGEEFPASEGRTHSTRV